MSTGIQNIFMIGPMASGKTTIGKRLAKVFNLDFFDCDQELERLTGASVNLIFDIEGEDGFRQRETRMLQDLTTRTGVLISTGGGAICIEENRQLLRSRGFVVYLKTSVENQLQRLSQDKSRPLLQTKDRGQRLRQLAQTRNPLYEATADLIFTTCDRSLHATTMALSSTIQKQLV